DDAPLEERRTQAVAARRWLDPESAAQFGQLDPAAIDAVREEAWPDPVTADELHDALMLLGLLPEGEAAGAGPVPRSPWQQLFDALLSARRATRIHVAGQTFWVAAEQLPMAAIIHPGHRPEPDI